MSSGLRGANGVNLVGPDYQDHGIGAYGEPEGLTQAQDPSLQPRLLNASLTLCRRWQNTPSGDAPQDQGHVYRQRLSQRN